MNRAWAFRVNSYVTVTVGFARPHSTAEDPPVSKLFAIGKKPPATKLHEKQADRLNFAEPELVTRRRRALDDCGSTMASPFFKLRWQKCVDLVIRKRQFFVFLQRVLSPGVCRVQGRGSCFANSVERFQIKRQSRVVCKLSIGRPTMKKRSFFIREIARIQR